MFLFCFNSAAEIVRTGRRKSSLSKGSGVSKRRRVAHFSPNAVAVEEAPALLVLGSSLAVMSGLRFVKAAAKQGTPVVIVNRGETRGDPCATVKLESGTSEFLGSLEAAHEHV